MNPHATWLVHRPPSCPYAHDSIVLKCQFLTVYTAPSHNTANTTRRLTYRRLYIQVSEDTNTASAHRPIVKPPAQLTPMSVYNPNSNPLFAAIPMLLSTPDGILSDTHLPILAYALLNPRLTFAVP